MSNLDGQILRWEDNGLKWANRWISVKDRLPEKNNWKVYAVLVSDDKLHKHQVAWFEHSSQSFRLEPKPCKKIKVTHWMPLPEPPNAP